ncbi:MAG: histidine phosphatase family protein [Bryobacteraceae bacterium]
MEIYLLRHGQAEDRAPGRRDADRKLTPKGRRDVQATLALANLDPQLILSSGLRRADQTAAIASERFTTTPSLLPTADPADLWTELRSTNLDRVLLVGHEPHLGHFISLLLGAPISVDFKKGAILRIDARKELPGTLRWMLTPRLAL